MSTQHASNDDIARTLGRMEGKLDAQSQSSARQEHALLELDRKLSTRLNDHDQRLRDLEIANPGEISKAVKDHEERLQALEKNGVRMGVATGAAGSVAMTILVEYVRKNLGL